MYSLVKKLNFFLFVLSILLMIGLAPAWSKTLAPVEIRTNPALIKQEQSDKLPVYLFWGDGCPHCHAEMVFLEKIKKDYPQIEFKKYEVYNNKNNYELFNQLAKEKGIEVKGVPTLFIGDEVIVGFSTEDITGARIKQALDIYLIKNQIKPETTESEERLNQEDRQDKIVDYPLLGKIKLNDLSLPILTAVLGTLDGFNPCSMWALIILITLLINTGSRKKMWLVGSVFILASAFSYFLFLTAWLNAFLLIGYLKIVRLLIGLLAIGVGIYFLYDAYKKRKQDVLTCEVSNEETKNKIIQRLENTLHKKSIWAVIIGIIMVAFSVNLIELMCSAGIPAIYTQILSQNHLPRLSYYLYLIGYDFFYMLDDIIVLIIAGLTWQLLQGTQKYTKYSHLIGGVLILILGIIMIVNPGLLSFK